MKRKDIPSPDAALDAFPETNIDYLPEEYVTKEELRQQLLEIIDGLPEAMRVCVVMHYYENMKSAQIAEVLDTSEAAVNMQLYRARAKIRTEIATHNPKAYSNGLLPFSALGTILQGEATGMITVSMIKAALVTAGITKAGALAATQLSLAGWVTTLSVTAACVTTAAVVTTVSVASPWFAAAAAGNDPQHAQQQAAAGQYEDIASVPGAEALMDFSEALGESSAPGETGSGALSSSGTQSISGSGSEAFSGSSSQAQPGLAAGGAYTASLTGGIHLLDTGGEVLDCGDLLSGLTLALLDEEGKTLAQTESGNGGRFAFASLRLAAGGVYTVRMALPPGHPFAPVQPSPGGEIELEWQAGDTQPPVDLFVQLAVSPDGSVDLLQGDCGCGHVNPRKAIIRSNGLLSGQQSWQILRASDNGVVYSGDGPIIERELRQLYDGGLDGVYTIAFTHVDEAGNAAQVRKDFVIDTGEIRPNQYS